MGNRTKWIHSDIGPAEELPKPGLKKNVMLVTPVVLDPTDDDIYPMCKPQLAQLDCRLDNCTYNYHGGQCRNGAPAISLNNGSAICWSMKEREEKSCL